MKAVVMTMMLASPKIIRNDEQKTRDGLQDLGFKLHSARKKSEIPRAMQIET